MAAQSTLNSRMDTPVIMYRYLVAAARKTYKKSSRTSKTLGAFALLLSLIGTAYGGYKYKAVTVAEQRQARRLIRRNSGLRGKNGSRIIYVPMQSCMGYSGNEKTSKVTIFPTKQTTFEAHRRLFLEEPRLRSSSKESPDKVGGLPSTVPSPSSTKPGINLAFLHRFLSLSSIMIPRWNSKESGLLISHGVFLLLRTYLSFVVARLDGEIVRSLVAAKGRPFIVGIMRWCGVGVIASYVNGMIKFLRSKLAIAFRTRLTRYIHDLYLNGNCNYYKLLNLDGGVGQSVDHYVTQDLTLFCSASAALYSSIGKPLVDICFFNYQLYRSLGSLALTGILAGYLSTAILLRRISPPFGKLAAGEVKLEGDYRGLHSRLLSNAEEVAFYNGAQLERQHLDKSFSHLDNWSRKIYRLKAKHGMIEDILLKYAWSAFGYMLSSLPVFLPASASMIAAAGMSDDSNNRHPQRGRSRMGEFITNKRLMLSLGDAGGRLMYSLKDLAELAGYTSRVYTLIATLHRVHANAYYPLSGTRSELFSLSDVQGTTHAGYSGLRFEDVPVVAPALWPREGTTLIEALSFNIHSGDHTLISGSNGLGKSAIARILTGLWPVYRGLASRPKNFGFDGIMVLPQRPYLSSGTLRDQVIYPHSELDMADAGRHDSHLMQILEAVYLGYLPNREGGWDTRKEWKDVLSGGEKQRMAFARLLYHEPQFAILDEATSAVSSDVEGSLYECGKSNGITLLTISTRASLKKYHTITLDLFLNGKGVGCTINRIGTEQEKMEVDKEVKDLRKRLRQVGKLAERKKEIEQQLR